MKTIEAEAIVNASGQITIQSPVPLAPGAYQVVVVLADSGIASSATPYDPDTWWAQVQPLIGSLAHMSDEDVDEWIADLRGRPGNNRLERLYGDDQQ